MSELEYHRIAEVEEGRLRGRYPRYVGNNSHLGRHGDGETSSVAVVRTDQGAAGWGLLRGTLDARAELVARAVSDVFDPAVGVTDGRALPLDFALHDLAGVILGQPVYEMLGRRGERASPCYDGAIYMDDLDPEGAPHGVGAVLENCARDYERGYRAFKLKVGRGHRWMEARAGLRRDIEATRAVREQFPDCQVLVDANNGYTGEGFLEYMEGVRDCGLFWVEEPFEETREDLTRLRRHLDRCSPRTLIADGELRPDVPFLLELAAERLLDVLLMDVVGLGLTAWRALMPRLREVGVLASPHAWGMPLKTLYAAQLAAGLGNVVTVEGVPGTVDGVDSGGYRLEAGLIHVPDAPGFGIAPPLVDAARRATW